MYFSFFYFQGTQQVDKFGFDVTVAGDFFESLQISGE